MYLTKCNGFLHILGTRSVSGKQMCMIYRKCANKLLGVLQRFYFFFIQFFGIFKLVTYLCVLGALGCKERNQFELLQLFFFCVWNAGISFGGNGYHLETSLERIITLNRQKTDSPNLLVKT